MDEQRRTEQKERLEFRGGWGMSFLPAVIFLFFCVLYFVIFKAFEMYALAMGAFVGLLAGGLFVKKGHYDSSGMLSIKGLTRRFRSVSCF